MTISGFLNRLKRREGLDVSWYLRTYPQVVSELERGLTPEEHYDRVGRYRGYLPRADAQRLEWPDRPQSRFGGLWTDQANALDLVDGKLDLGMINAQQADTLREWIRDGYVILKGALPSQMVEGARAELDKAYSGGFPDVVFDCDYHAPKISTFRSYHRDLPTKALDLHWQSQATRDAIFAPKILEFLYLVFQRRPMATQTLGFFRGSAQGGHQDAAYVSYSNYMHFAASWIALEDVTPGAGELFYYPGSQKLPDYLYPGENKNIIDTQRRNPQLNISSFITEHVNMLPDLCARRGIEQQRFTAKAGDVLIWSADLVHGGSPISSDATRKSMVTHYCPKELVPLYFEDGPREIRFHESGNPYTTGLPNPTSGVRRLLSKISDLGGKLR